MATIPQQQQAEPSVLDAGHSWARRTLDGIRRSFLAAVRAWIALVFAALVLSVVQLPYPLTIALLLIVYRMQEQQEWAERLKGVEEAVAWGMRRGNWQ